jgi:hypothetical protein
MTVSEMREVIMPTMSYLQRVKDACKERHLVFGLNEDQTVEVRTEVGKRLRMFEAVCLGEKEASMKDMIRLSEDFVLLVALEEKWSAEIRHKCSCADFFKEAQCEHAVALSLFLTPAEVSVPTDADIRVVNQRRRLKRGRAANDVEDDDKEEQRKKPAPEARPEPTLKEGILSDSEESPGSRGVSPPKPDKGPGKRKKRVSHIVKSIMPKKCTYISPLAAGGSSEACITTEYIITHGTTPSTGNCIAAIKRGTC